MHPGLFFPWATNFNAIITIIFYFGTIFINSATKTPIGGKKF